MMKDAAATQHHTRCTRGSFCHNQHSMFHRGAPVKPCQWRQLLVTDVSLTAPCCQRRGVQWAPHVLPAWLHLPRVPCLSESKCLTNCLRGSWSYKDDLHLFQLWFKHMTPWCPSAQCGGLRQGTLHKLLPQAGLEHVGPRTSLAHKYLLTSHRQKGLTQCSRTSPLRGCLQPL